MMGNGRVQDNFMDDGVVDGVDFVECGNEGPEDVVMSPVACGKGNGRRLAPL